MDDWLTIGRRLIQTREALGYGGWGKQGKFAEAIGCSPSRYNQYETGNDKRGITIEVAVNLCEQFPVTLDWIFRGEIKGVGSELADKLREIMRRDKIEARRLQRQK
jgi:transcriptional regulator with XRE-family HTH domain